MKVSRIEIETEEGKILLTIQQAKTLHADLNELFGEKEKVIERTVTVPNDRWPVTLPWTTTEPVWYGSSIPCSPPAGGETICLSMLRAENE